MHHVVIGNGIAGSHAAAVLRERDRNSRVTVISAGALLFYNRYELPDIFRGRQDWVDYLVHPPAYYEERNITLRRKTIVSNVDPERRQISLLHREVMSYDQLLLATGGAGYIPERLLDYRALMHGFNNFRLGMKAFHALPKNGTVTMLGGDVLGLDLARTIVDTGFHVRLVASDRAFWPHVVDPSQRATYLACLEKMGIEVIDGQPVERIEKVGEEGGKRRVVLEGGGEIVSDVVMPFYGLIPAVDFMSNAGVDVERGFLVNPMLRTTQEDIWAAGDVCQIWSPEQKSYRFYYGWRNVKMMGDVAARNMTGDNAAFQSTVDDSLRVNSDGTLHSPFWEHD